MRTRFPLKPGQQGTKQFRVQYGDRLVCVRCRYDAPRQKRCKTVELLVAERAWEPPAPRCPADTSVGRRIGFAEVDMRERVKQAGGEWHRRHKGGVWRYDQVVALTLEARIVEEYEASTYRCPDESLKYLYVDALVVSICRCKYLYVDAKI